MGKLVALLTDGRFSGATRGICVGCACPKAADEGPLALLQDGDRIAIDAHVRTVTLALDDAELSRCRAAWQPRRDQAPRRCIGEVLDGVFSDRAPDRGPSATRPRTAGHCSAPPASGILPPPGRAASLRPRGPGRGAAGPPEDPGADGRQESGDLRIGGRRRGMGPRRCVSPELYSRGTRPRWPRADGRAGSARRRRWRRGRRRR